MCVGSPAPVKSVGDGETAVMNLTVFWPDEMVPGECPVVLLVQVFVRMRELIPNQSRFSISHRPAGSSPLPQQVQPVRD